MSGTLDVLFTLFFGYNAGYFAILSILYIAGLWLLFVKSGISPWWALVPCCRSYMLAKCAGNIKAGRVLFVLDVLSTVFNLVGERIEIATFSLPVAALVLAVVIINVIYKIRVSKDLADVYGVGRIWVAAWVLADWAVAPIWGISKKFMPYARADMLVPEDAASEGVQELHSWFNDLKTNTKRLFGFFAFGGDWKSFPIAVVITTIVASIARTDFFTSMDGTIKGSLALTCIAIWNGCFNSILVVSRERAEVRRFFEAGMKPSAYIVSIFIYQLAVCIIQTVLTIYTCSLIGMQFPKEGLFINSLLVEIGFTMFLITLAADMVSLTISAIARDAVSAMTIMPFVLVIQLVFSGSVINVSTWNNSISRYTISNYGVKCIASQADYNRRPMMLAWNTLQSIRQNRVGTVVNLGDVMDALQDKNGSPAMKEFRAMEVGELFPIEEIRNRLDGNKTYNDLLDRDLGIEITVGEILDFLQDEERFPFIRDLRATDISKSFTSDEIRDLINRTDSIKAVKDKKILYGLVTVGSVIELVLDIINDQTFNVTVNIGDLLDKVLALDNVVAAREKKPFEGLTLRNVIEISGIGRTVEKMGESVSESHITVGQLIDFVLEKEQVKKLRDVDLDFTVTIDEIIRAVGEDRVKDFLIRTTSDAAMVEEYSHTRENVAGYWQMLAIFILVFAFIASVSIEVGTRWGIRKKQ